MFGKVTYNSITRKFKMESSFGVTALRKELIRCFGEEVQNLSVGYVDEDNEFVSITSDEDLKVCIEEFAVKNSGKINTISLVLKQDGFTRVEESVVEQTEKAQDTTCSEIQEDPKIELPILEKIPSKVIEEIKPTETIEEKPVEEPEINMNQFMTNIVGNLQSHFSKFLNIQPSQIEAYLEPVTTRNVDESCTSTLTGEMKNEIEDLITARLSQHLNSKPAEAPKTGKLSQKCPHKGITCDGCHTAIKEGARFKSLTRDDFDLCECCESKGLHTDPMVRFSVPFHHNNWQTNKKFSDFKGFFTGGKCPAQQSGSVSEEARQPETRGCPFRENRNIFGQFGCNRRGFNQPNFLDAVSQLVPPELMKKMCAKFEEHCKPAETKKEEPKKELLVKKIVSEVQAVFPEWSEEFIEEVVEKNKYTNAQQLISSLYD